jgi:hypothetical protein
MTSERVIDMTSETMIDFVGIPNFEINGRGRVISFEAHTVGDATMNEVQFTFGPEQNR